MSDIVINYIDIIQAIGEQIQQVWYALQESDKEEIIREISNIKKIEVSDEQSFNKKRSENKVEKGAVYVVVRFGSGSINYGSSLTPISLYVMGTANKVKPTQILLSVFASAWTTKALAQDIQDENGNLLEIENASQVWNTPEIITNFNEVDADFKNLFRLTGNIVVGSSTVRVGKLTYFYGETDNYPHLPAVGWEEVNIMSFQDGYRASLDSQPFMNTDGFAQSEVNFSTYTFSISTYLLDNQISADMLAIRGFRNKIAPVYDATSTYSVGDIVFYNDGLGGYIYSCISDISTPETFDATHWKQIKRAFYSTFSQNQYMKIKLEFTNGFTNIPNDNDFFSSFKVVDSSIGQEIAGIPTLNITFTR